MSFVKNYNSEEITEMSMIEVAYELMKEHKQPFVYPALMKQVAEIKGMTEAEVKERTSYLYTDLNVDGRFLSLGENRWGLRSWYPFEQGEEDITTPVKTKKKKKKAVKEDEEDIFEDDELLADDDEFEDLEDELDEIANNDDSDDDDDVDIDEEDEDFEDDDEINDDDDIK